MNILVAGGAGYIGSHTCIELIESGYNVVIVDNFYNSSPLVIDRIEKITGKRPIFYQVDICDYDKIEQVFKENKIDSIIHFAAYKAVGESVEKPIEYYNNNLKTSLNLMSLAKKYKVGSFIFSSSATVYGQPESLPIKEDFPLSTTNPYGSTKLMIENMLKDVAKCEDSFKVVILRYFNPLGAHKSGLIGEAPDGIPNNLLPYLLKVAAGELSKLHVFGNDYDTKDGTGVRDYIHVLDLARGHVVAIDNIDKLDKLEIFNLGTGRGYSVMELIEAVERVSRNNIPYVIDPRREGDIAECYADSSRAKRELNWEARYGLMEMVEDSWRWQVKNPGGYR